MRLNLRFSLAPSDMAWIVLVVGIIVYELLAKDGELLSEASDRYCRQPGLKGWLVRGFVFATAAHVAHVLPHRFDLFHWDAAWFRPLRSTRAAIRRTT
jgi:hypothetical protein